MIPIVAKDRDSFVAICKYFNITESEADFVDCQSHMQKTIEMNKALMKPNKHYPEMKNVRGCADWINYEHAT